MALEQWIAENAEFIAGTLYVTAGVVGMFAVAAFLAKMERVAENKGDIDDLEEVLGTAGYFSDYDHGLDVQERLHRVEVSTGVQAACDLDEDASCVCEEVRQ